MRRSSSSSKPPRFLRSVSNERSVKFLEMPRRFLGHEFGAVLLVREAQLVGELLAVEQVADAAARQGAEQGGKGRPECGIHGGATIREYSQ